MVETNYVEGLVCALVLRAQAGDGEATHELLERTRDLRQKTMRHLLRRHQVRLQDGEDYMQEAVFWTLDAVQRYAPQRFPGCSFRTYLNRVLRWRLLEQLRQRARRSHLPYAVEWIPQVEADENAQPADYRQAGPGPQAERRELLEQLDEVLRQLEPLERRLWRLLRSGVPLREIAAELELSLEQVHRVRRRLLAVLQEKLAASR